MHTVSNEIASALQQIILNGAALVAATAAGDSSEANLGFDYCSETTEKGNVKFEEEDEENCEIDLVELLAQNQSFPTLQY